MTRREWNDVARTGRRWILYCRVWSWVRGLIGVYLGGKEKSN